MDAIDIRIIPSRTQDLILLQETFSPQNIAMHHTARHRVQERGEGVYLIAWHMETPIGHFLLKWNGPDIDTSEKYPYPTTYLEAGFTLPTYRRKGVATQLITHALELVIQRDGKKIGLAVGKEDNQMASKLYSSLGFKEWEYGPFTVSSVTQTPDFRVKLETEECIYMFKDII